MTRLLFSLSVVAFSAGAVRADDFGNRTKTVTTALETQLKKKAPEITTADLATVTELNLPHVHLPHFNADDFAGLPKLKKLRFYSLFHKGRKADEVPAFTKEVFAKLPHLEELIIESDQLGTLPDDAFAGLTSLKVLELNGVSFARVPKSLTELPKIEAIYCDPQWLSKDDYAKLQTAFGDKLKPKREKK